MHDCDDQSYLHTVKLFVKTGNNIVSCGMISTTVTSDKGKKIKDDTTRSMVLAEKAISPDCPISSSRASY